MILEAPATMTRRQGVECRLSEVAGFSGQWPISRMTLSAVASKADTNRPQGTSAKCQAEVARLFAHVIGDARGRLGRVAIECRAG